MYTVTIYTPDGQFVSTARAASPYAAKRRATQCWYGRQSCVRLDVHISHNSTGETHLYTVTNGRLN